MELIIYIYIYSLKRGAKNIFECNAIQFDLLIAKIISTPHSRSIHMKFVKGSFSRNAFQLFNRGIPCENELCDLFIQYSDVFCLSNKFIVAQYRYVSRVWNIQRALNFMEMHLIDKIPTSFSLFLSFFSLSLSLFFPHSLYPHCLFLSFTEGKKRANNGAHFHTGHKVKVSLHIVALYIHRKNI